MSGLKSLVGKVALITGGSKGIGRATAVRLAHEGVKVVINYSNDSSSADEVVKEIGADKAFAIKADAGNVESISHMVEETAKKFGSLDIVVASAALMKLGELPDVTESDYDTTFNLNVKGPLFLAQKAAAIMKPGSSIILFSTTQCAASTVTPNYLTYCMSKGAIEQMTRVMSKEVAKKGIMLNCVAPGPTATDLFLRGKSEQLIKTLSGFNPQGRIGKPEEIADTVAFLAGTTWVSGQVLRANGGMA
ncbi:Brn1 [Coleophoma cylindrospora]|uniref:Brn1 n=1 Tax=Coleophoma cylindrospora TaxID=1849047 RepID=A0A3D8RGT6_9HELO|nr:Brn1 [Coleophoma cylindrospora]